MTRVIALFLAALAGAAVVAEAVLVAFPVPAVEAHRRRPENRRDVFFIYEPVLGWRGRPDAQGRLEGLEFTTTVSLNSQGFRDREVTAAKPPGTLRLLVLGDSITWGHGVEQHERYTDLLGQRLGRAGHIVEIVNLAVSGYATDQEALLFERMVPAYCPDLVLVGLYENDLRENVSALQGRYPKPRFRLTLDGRLAIENVPVPRVPAAEPAAPAPESRVKRVFRERVRLYAALAFVRETARRMVAAEPPPASVPPEAIQLTGAILRRLSASVADSGAQFLVLALPDRLRSHATAEAAAQAGVGPVLDLTPAFAAAGGWDALFQRLDGAHWTARGHAVAADAIARFLLDGHVLTAPPRRCG